MADKAITRRLKIFVNGEEVDATITNLRKNLAKFRTLANREIEGTDKFKKYNQEVAKLEGEYDQARKAQKTFRDDVKLTAAGVTDSEKALSDFTGSFSQMIDGYRSGDILQVKEGFNGIKAGIQGATKAALAFIATPIGIAITALVGIGVAAKAWFDYNSQIVQALRLTQQITGETGEAANQARVRGEALADTFDLDFKETLLTANSLAQQFGISFNEAFDVLENQLVRGQKNNDEFFQSLNEYPTFFKQAGFSAEEFGRIISTGYDLGIYSDKLPDALKEFDLAIKEQTKTTRDALVNAFGAPFTDEILRKVKTGEITSKEALEAIAIEADKANINVQQNAQLTADLFKGAGEDAGGALKIFDAYNQAIVENQRELSESEAILQEQINLNKELDTVLSSIFSTGDQGFGLLIDKAKVFATKILVDLLKIGVDVYNYFVDLNNESRVFSAVLTTAGIAATTTFEIIGILIENAKTAFSGLGDVIEGVFTLDADKIAEGLAKNAKASIDTFNDIKAKAIADAEEIKNAFAGNNKLERKTFNGLTEGATESGDQTPRKLTPNVAGGDLSKEAKKAIEAKKKLLDKILELEKQALDAKLDLDEQEIEKIRDKYSQLLKEAEKGSEAEARLLVLQQGEIDAKKVEQEREFQEEKEKIRKQYDLLSNEDKKAEELASLKSLYDSKLLSEEEYQAAKKGIEDNYRLIKEEEANERKELERERIEEEFEAKLDRDELTDAQLYDAELERLQALLDAKFISQQTYEARVEALENQRLQQRIQKTQAVLGAINNLVQTAKQFELDSIAEVVKRKGESEEEFIKRKEKAEEKKKEINKKYALTEMLITVGQTIANTSLAIIRAFSDLGPIAGAIAAAFVGTTGAIQIAQAKKQYNQVKSFARGGDTGTGNMGLGSNSGGFVRGVVEENEYVVPRYVRQMPGVPKIIQYLEAKRTGNDSSFAEGGDASDTTSIPELTDSGLMARVANFLEKLSDQLDRGLFINYTLTDEIDRRELAQKLDDTINESKGN